MDLAYWLYENYIEKLSFPWGYHESVDSFNGFMYLKNIFIKGKFYLYSSTGKTEKDDFDYIQFIDNIPISQREVIKQTFKFYLSLADFREFSFYDSMDFIIDDSSSPIDLNSLKVQSAESTEDEDFSGENLIFSRVITRVPIEKEDESLRTFSQSYIIAEEAIFSTYVFGFSAYRSIFMKNSLTKLCPFAIFRLSQLSESKVIKDRKPTKIISNVIIETVCKESKIFNNQMINDLFRFFPLRSQVEDISLVFTNLVHGCSLNTLYRLARESISAKYLSPIFILVFQDFNQTVFGAVLADHPSPSDSYLGNGETFVFTFKNKILEVYKWSGKNEYFQLGTPCSFSVGCDLGKYAIWIDDRLFKGRSQDCKTFDCPQLTIETDFECKIVELWAFSLY